MQHLNGPAPDIVIVDQLPYHIVWPRGGNASALAETMKRAFPVALLAQSIYWSLSSIMIFRLNIMRGFGLVVKGPRTINNPLPKRHTILINLDDSITMDSQEDGGFAHDEADVTIIAYLLQAAEFGKEDIWILCDDTTYKCTCVVDVLGPENVT